MIYGTHNSLTGYPLLGWQRIFGFIINLFTRCQTKTIEEQLALGVRWFNLQVNLKGGKWYASHGIAWYDVDVMKVLRKLDDFADLNGEKIYIQLYMDKHILHHTDHIAFRGFAKTVMAIFEHLTFERVYDEQHDQLILEEGLNDGCEAYWTTTWVKNVGNKWYYNIPFPKLWRKKALETTLIPDETQYLMVDFVEKVV